MDNISRFLNNFLFHTLNLLCFRTDSLLAFLFGWMSMLVMDPGITAALAVGVASYTSYLFKLPPVGIKIVAINGDTTPRGLSTRDRPVRTAADFARLKIRTAASPTVLKAMKTLGALPQQVPSTVPMGDADRLRSQVLDFVAACREGVS